MYQNVKHIYSLDNESVHDLSWPSYDAKLIDDSLEKDMNVVKSVIQGILFAREKVQLGVRWPLKQAIVETGNKDAKQAIIRFAELIKVQTNVKRIAIKPKIKEITITIKPNFASIGKLYGNKTHIIIEQIQKENAEKVVKDIEKKSKYVLKIEKDKFDITKESITIEKKSPDSLQPAEFRFGSLYIDKTRTAELEAEGFTREIIRRVQSARKDAGMQRTDMIELYLKLPLEMINSISKMAKQIKKITGSKGVMIGNNEPEKQYTSAVSEKIKTSEIKIFFNRI
jgi:isoleucyl-tRNA synthetase